MNMHSNLGETQHLPDGSRQSEKDVAETFLPAQTVLHVWQAPDYRAAHYIRAGLLLGGLAGCTSLVFNVVGSVLWPAISGHAQHSLRIIQVYLTFPLGEAALQLDSGALLAIGCVAYLATGMLYGMLFEWAISFFIPNSGVFGRFVFCSALALLVWGLNFYGILIWLQPLLFGQRWIVDLIPWWVAAATHVVFGCTMALLYPLGADERTRPTRMATRP